jgi:hypothetical protein
LFSTDEAYWAAEEEASGLNNFWSENRVLQQREAGDAQRQRRRPASTL